MGNLVFNGISSESLGVVIQTPPVYEFPTKNYDIHQVSGKNGDIIIDRESYNNVNREYSLASVFRYKEKTFVEAARQVVDWLNSSSGYARLEDSYEPDYYRMAMFRSGGQLPNLYDKATGLNVRFECKPQRYLKLGDQYINGVLGEPFEIINNTNYIALPEIKVNGDFTKITVIRGNSLTDFISKTEITKNGVISSGELIFDSELQDVYTVNSYENNKIIMTNGFPKLYPGKNIILIEGSNGTTITYKPRWWVL